MTIQTARQEHCARGLFPGNPLHVLAALGTFRLLDLHDPEAQMGWRLEDDGAFHPLYKTTLEQNDVVKSLAESFGWQQGEEEPGGKCAPQGSKRAAKGEKGQKCQKTPREERLKKLFPVVFEEVPVKATNGDDTADGGTKKPEASVIARPPECFRHMALGTLDPQGWSGALLIQEELVAAFGCDACIEEKKNTVTPSLLSFSNGGSGKELLKDFKNCALRVTPESVERTLSGSSPNADVTTSLCWSPEDRRSHALQWEDPAKAKEPCDATANALAFLGLCCFPSAPGERGLMTAGFSLRGDRWVYPVWQPLLPLAVVRSLLLQDPRQTFSGKEESPSLVWWEAQRYVVNKRSFFAPGIPVVGEKRSGHP